MKLLLLGSGGREHALAWKIAQSPKIEKLYIAPGNAGTREVGENVAIKADDFEGIKQFVTAHGIDMVVVGPEDPLVKGVYDFFKNDDELKQVPVIGPSKAGAVLEGSKEFAKGFMQRHHIPTAGYKSVTAANLEEGLAFLETLEAPYVLKADGLCAGKGVLILPTLEEAKKELKEMLGGMFGNASAGENMSYSFSQLVITYLINILGNDSLATRTYTVNTTMFVYLFAIAMAQGGAISIGHLVGQKRIRAAYLLGKYVMRLSILVSLGLSCIWAIFGHTIFSMLTDNENIIRLGVTILIVDVIVEIGRAVNIYATNALRSAGDVNFPFYVGLIVQWTVSVGLSYLFGIHLGWGLVGMWCAFLLDENIRAFIFVKRWNSLKWAKKGFVK